MGSAAESLWFGVPTVAIPQAVDQHQNAEALEATGAGVHLPDEAVSAESLRAAVAPTLGAGARARAPALREDVRRSGGIAASADTVERSVRGALNSGRAGSAAGTTPAGVITRCSAIVVLQSVVLLEETDELGHHGGRTHRRDPQVRALGDLNRRSGP